MPQRQKRVFSAKVGRIPRLNAGLEACNHSPSLSPSLAIQLGALTLPSVAGVIGYLRGRRRPNSVAPAVNMVRGCRFKLPDPGPAYLVGSTSSADSRDARVPGLPNALVVKYDWGVRPDWADHSSHPFRIARGAVRSGAVRVFIDGSARRAQGATAGQLLRVLRACAATALPRRQPVARFAPSLPYQPNLE